MKIQLASFDSKLTSSEKRKSVLEIFNNSKADIVLFAGYTLDGISDIDKISDRLDNDKTVGFIEVKEFGARKLTNWQFRIENNKVWNCHTHQIFKDSSEINRNRFCAEQLIHELSSNRKFNIGGKQISLLVCGEINILKNIQSQGNKVEVRTSDSELARSFDAVLKQANIILNPMHTPMGNQGKMAKRRVYLSKNGRAYFSTANLDGEYGLETRKLQYGFVNGREVIGDIVMSTPEYIVREYQM